jgi:8-oxo-dGTP pyrophosphatase MutT (NUDIX family)
MKIDESNPWKKLKSDFIYQNPWISVREDQVINPSGGNGIYGVVSMKNKAVGVVPLDQDGYTYLVGQYRYTLDEFTWEIPEGGCPIGTSALDTAKRELKEETGMTAKKWTSLSRIHTSNSVTDEEGFLFLAEELSMGDSEPEETEKLFVKKIKFSEALDMVMKSQITDSLSTTALLMVARLKGF